MRSVGVDIGGSGVKAAVVESSTGELITQRVRVETPSNANRAELEGCLLELLERVGWQEGPLGIGFPGVIREGTIQTAANLSHSLIGWNLRKTFEDHGFGPVALLNDADAAGVAEMHFGAGKDFHNQTVLLLTVGTGIGSVLFFKGGLVPNLEFGHIEFHGKPAERLVSERARKQGDLSWKRWGKRFNSFLEYMAFLTQPDAIILGGGGVKRPEKFAEFLTVQTPIHYAAFGNLAGIVGAAIAAAEG